MRSSQVFPGNQLNMLPGFQLIGFERALFVLFVERTRLKSVDIGPSRLGSIIRLRILVSQWLKQRTSGAACDQNDEPERINGSLWHRLILDDTRTVDLDTRIAKSSVYLIGSKAATSTRE